MSQINTSNVSIKSPPPPPLNNHGLADKLLTVQKTLDVIEFGEVDLNVLLCSVAESQSVAHF